MHNVVPWVLFNVVWYAADTSVNAVAPLFFVSQGRPLKRGRHGEGEGEEAQEKPVKPWVPGRKMHDQTYLYKYFRVRLLCSTVTGSICCPLFRSLTLAMHTRATQLVSRLTRGFVSSAFCRAASAEALGV